MYHLSFIYSVSSLVIIIISVFVVVVFVVVSHVRSHAVFEAEVTLKKCLPLGTNISWFCILSRVERDQERKNRMGKSFFMHISFNYIKKGGGGGFKIRYHHLFLGPASERNKLERWEWRHWKDLSLQIMNHIWFLKIRAKLTEQTSFKVKKSIFDGEWGPMRRLMRTQGYPVPVGGPREPTCGSWEPTLGFQEPTWGSQ